MQSCHNKLLPNHVYDYFIPIWSIHSCCITLTIINNLFFLELTYLQENIPLHLLAQICRLQYTTVLSLLPFLPSNGNSRTPLACKRY